MKRRSLRLAGLAFSTLLASLTLAACERVVRDMYAQPRKDPDEPSPLWPDGRATRPPVPGTVAFARGDLAATSSGRRGERADAPPADGPPPPVTQRLLRRGQQRFTIFCQPCHSPLGDGDGWVVRRGFPAPPSYHQPRLREASDAQLYQVITRGHGVMVSYADRLKPEDRWAVVAYLRALQLSQHAPLGRLPAALQAALRRLPAPER